MAGSPQDDFSDLVELGIDLDEVDSITNQFNKAAKHMQSLASSLNNETLLEMYGYYKQALEGNCNIPKPSWYDVRGKSKWEAWNKLRDLDKNEAKKLYIEGVKRLDNTFEFDIEKPSESWVKVSCFSNDTNIISDKNVSDYIRENNMTEVKKYLKVNPNNVNSLDCEGLGLIHYAADIGSIEMLKLLLENNVDVNLMDEPQKQTALHYAASCGHLNCVKLLLENGADKNLMDIDGLTAEKMADNELIERLLK